MSTVQLWMEIRNVLPECSLFSGRIKKMGTHVKTRCCQVQMNNMHSIWRCVWKYFHADELHYPESIKEEYHSAWIFTYICVLGQSVHCLWIWIHSWAVDRWTKDLWRVLDVKAAPAIDYEWQANFCELESVCMNFCIQMGFISELCAITLLKKKKSCMVLQSPFCYFEIHCLCAAVYRLRETLILAHYAILNSSATYSKKNIFHYWYTELRLFKHISMLTV